MKFLLQTDGDSGIYCQEGSLAGIEKEGLIDRGDGNGEINNGDGKGRNGSKGRSR